MALKYLSYTPLICPKTSLHFNNLQFISVRMTQTKSQTTDTILMIRPAQFGFNTETADTNTFQNEPVESSQQDNLTKALIEFDDFVQLLREHKIYVIVLQDPGLPVTPDSLFPNNWISFHDDTVVLYPMLAKTGGWNAEPDGSAY